MASTVTLNMWRDWGYKTEKGNEIYAKPFSGKQLDAWREGVAQALKEENDTIKLTPQDIPVTSENPKAELGALKASLSYVPAGPLMEAALGMMEGGYKYGRHNYRAEGTKIRSSIYFDAIIRHMIAWWEGEDTDPDSGMHHVAKAITTLLVLRDSQMTGAFLDDRPPALPSGWLDTLNQKAAELKAKYPNPRPMTTQIKNGG